MRKHVPEALPRSNIYGVRQIELIPFWVGCEAFKEKRDTQRPLVLNRRPVFCLLEADAVDSIPRYYAVTAVGTGLVQAAVSVAANPHVVVALIAHVGKMNHI